MVVSQGKYMHIFFESRNGVVSWARHPLPLSDALVFCGSPSPQRLSSLEFWSLFLVALSLNLKLSHLRSLTSLSVSISDFSLGLALTVSRSPPPSSPSSKIVRGRIVSVAVADSSSSLAVLLFGFMADQGLESSQPVDLTKHPSGIVPTLHYCTSEILYQRSIWTVSWTLKRLHFKLVMQSTIPRQRFAAVIMRIREPKTTALIFASGKMVCTGAKSEQQSKLAARKYARIIQKLGFPAKFKELQWDGLKRSEVLRFQKNDSFHYSLYKRFCHKFHNTFTKIQFLLEALNRARKRETPRQGAPSNRLRTGQWLRWNRASAGGTVAVRRRLPCSHGGCSMEGKEALHGSTGRSDPVFRTLYLIVVDSFCFMLQDFKIQNIVGSCDVKFPIRLEGLAYSHGAFSSYEPELFPGLIYRMKQPKIVLLIFVSGKIVLTGAKVRDETYTAFENIYPVLTEFRKNQQWYGCGFVHFNIITAIYWFTP
ncbi:hypothetical protein Ahy_A08g037525 isoform B [Arachis hypogaea]|uniref:TATA-box-binding protein n=1 Tax=Arachis hypogaea TaxID=3818 RepID=A0A445BR06_ARAHY|nr:hypothetical protein Ahy_A08g037525 isoform B [Arachis hypogaea]